MDIAIGLGKKRSYVVIEDNGKLVKEGYVGTVGDETTANAIRNYVLRQGTKEEKKDYRQLKLSVF